MIPNWPYRLSVGQLTQHGGKHCKLCGPALNYQRPIWSDLTGIEQFNLREAGLEISFAPVMSVLCYLDPFVAPATWADSSLSEPTGQETAPHPAHIGIYPGLQLSHSFVPATFAAHVIISLRNRNLPLSNWPQHRDLCSLLLVPPICPDT